MGFLNSKHNNVNECVSNVSKQVAADLSGREAAQSFDFNVHLEKLALFLAQAWKDDHPDVSAYSEEAMNDCVLAVTTELAIAAKAVGGPVSLSILAGGGSAAARAICRQVFSDDSN